MVSGLISVAEVDPFPATANRSGLTNEKRQDLTLYLAQCPKAGSLIPGTGGLRKLRWARGGMGKRGGYRVIYYFFNEAVPIYLLSIYTKNYQINLTSQQKARLSALAEELKAGARQRMTARRNAR